MTRHIVREYMKGEYVEEKSCYKKCNYSGRSYRYFFNDIYTI